jgi:tight adherence protein B
VDTTTVLAMIFVGGGMAALVVGFLSRAYERDADLAQILDLPGAEQPDDPAHAEGDQHSSLVENTIGLAGRFIDSIDDKGAVVSKLERARLPLRTGEFVLVVTSFGVVVGAFVAAITNKWVLGLAALALAPLVGNMFLSQRISRRRKKFEEQFPDALSLVASSLAAGHTFLRAIQMMTEESEPPLSEEFLRVVNETQLGDPLVDSLDRMARRLDVRDVAWVVQAIRIQQTVGGKLGDLLFTLADFIRAREEVRREVDVLTAEGRVSAWVLGALPVFLLLAISVMNPGYMQPMFQGWGWVFLGISGVMVTFGVIVINRMVKVQV